MVIRFPNIQLHCNEAVLCLNFGTPENNEFSIWDKNLLSLGVPILKHIGYLEKWQKFQRYNGMFSSK